RLSNRHGATSVMESPRLGYLPEAMVNFLALLGWNPGGDRELLSRDELISLFTLEGGHQRRQRRLQHRQARLVQPAAHRPPAGADAAGANRAAAARGRTLARHAENDGGGVDRIRARAAQAAREDARSAGGRAAALPRG